MTNSEIDLNTATPEQKERVLDYKIHLKQEKAALEIEKRKNEWTSCCFRCDKEVIVFAVHSTVLAGLMTFSCAMLAGDTDDKSTYQSLLTLALGLLIPSPRLNQKKN